MISKPGLAFAEWKPALQCRLSQLPVIVRARRLHRGCRKLQSKPEACKLLAGGSAPATPPASDTTDTMHPEGVPEGTRHAFHVPQPSLPSCLPHQRSHCVADFRRELKKASSVCGHDEIGMRAFGWQEGYAAFTVSASARTAVQDYIANQEEHHRRRTFGRNSWSCWKRPESNMTLAI